MKKLSLIALTLLTSCSICMHEHYHESDVPARSVKVEPLPSGGVQITPLEVSSINALPGSTSCVTVGPGDHYSVDAYGSMRPAKDEMAPSTSGKGGGLIWQDSSSMRSCGLFNKAVY